MDRTGLRSDWLHDAKWGVFMHFLAAPASSSQGEEIDAVAWNRRVDAFDVKGVTRQLLDTKAKYVVLTIGQNSGHYCSPNATYDRIVGISPSKCSRRDLVAELADALEPHGVRLMAYLPAGAPEYAPRAVERLEWKKGGRCAEFQRKWEAVIREWSLRWGRKVAGWWFDGCYFNDEMYRHSDEPNFTSFAAAIRAGNPDAAIAWNPGVKYPPFTVDSEEDYTAGEINEPRDVDSPGRWDKQALFHILTFLGKSWGQLPLRFTADEAAAHTLAFTIHGGVFTWDVPLTYEGLIDQGALDILKRVGDAVDATRGRPDLPSPAVPRTAVTFLESPSVGSQGPQTGRALVTLRNPWGGAIRGQVGCAIEPASAGRIDGQENLAYELGPGAETSSEFHFTIDGSTLAETQPRLVLRKDGCARQLNYPLPRRERITLTRLSELPPLDGLAQALGAAPIKTVCNDQGRALADIRLAAANGHLAISCQVSDQIMRQTDNIWDGSCIEVFGIAAPGDSIKQLFLVPTADGAPAKAFRIVRSQGGAKTETVPAHEMSFATRPTASGYQSAALIPLAWWLERPTAPDVFFLEMVVNTGLDAGMFSRASLFGSSNAPNYTNGYARMESR